MDVLHVTHYNNELGEVVEYEMLDPPQCLAEMTPLIASSIAQLTHGHGQQTEDTHKLKEHRQQ